MFKDAISFSQEAKFASGRSEYLVKTAKIAVFEVDMGQKYRPIYYLNFFVSTHFWTNADTFHSLIVVPLMLKVIV